MIRCGGYQGPGSVHTQGLHAFAAAMSAVPVEIVEDVTADGSPATELLARVERGELDLCYFASSYLAARVPALLAFDLPFAFADRGAAYATWDGALGRLAAEAIGERTGFVALAFWDNGVRHLSNRVRPLRQPQDCDGMVIRTLDNRLHQDVFASFGFRPVVIDVRDLAAAVRDGRVDAQENPLTNTVNFGLHRNHRYHSLTGHLFGVALLLANRTWFDGMDRATRFALDRAIATATAAQRHLAGVEDTRCLAVLEVAGAEVLGADAIDIDAFRRAAAPVRDRAVQALEPAIRAAII